MRLLIALSLGALFSSCTAYEKSVDSRSIGVSGNATAEGGSGKVVYTVHYH